MRVRTIPYLLVCFVVACGADSGETADAGTSTSSDLGGFDIALGDSGDSDAFCGSIGATGEPLSIGRCEIGQTEQDCTGAPDESKTFVPLTDGDTMRIVQGFQGVTMLNFTVRAEEIDPGNPEDRFSDENPIVELKLFRTSYSVVGRFRERVAFQPDPEDYTAFIGADLFVLLGAEVPVRAGQTVTAVATVVDQAGQVRCGSVEFITE